MSGQTLAAGEIGHCRNADCRAPMASQRLAKELGVRMHRGHGLCASCARRTTDRGRGETPQPIPPEGWRELASCRSADPSLFDELVGRHALTASATATLRATAVRFCLGCPVRDLCSTEADQRKHVGLFGGVYRSWPNPFDGKSPYRRHELLDQPWMAEALERAS